MDEIDLNSIPFITPVVLSLGLLIVGSNKKWKKTQNLSTETMKKPQIPPGIHIPLHRSCPAVW